jgi:SAM-dependent methyltransferase
MAFFDHYSSGKPTALGKAFVKKSAQLLYQNITKVKPAAEVALEIGPGKGDFCDLWLAQGGNITAMEANSAMRQALSNKGIRVVEAFAPPLPFGSAEFDVVVASHVIEHMPTVVKAIELVEEMTRVCRPGGLVCIVAPDVRAWKFDFWNADYTHNYVTSPRRIEQLFLNTGLQVESQVLFSGYFSGFRGRFSSFLASLLPARLIDCLPHGHFLQVKLYKLKLTFLGNFLMIGRKL